jgi:hypothetical protein
MTMTDAEIESVRRYLGYPGGTEYKTMLSSRCADMLDSTSEATIRSHLRQLDRLQQQITNTVPFAAETFNSGSAGTRQYAPGQRLATLHQEANQYINEIASTLRIGIYRRIYGSSGGSGWSGGSTIRG